MNSISRFISGVLSTFIVFLIGLVSEQITALTYTRQNRA